MIAAPPAPLTPSVQPATRPREVDRRLGNGAETAFGCPRDFAGHRFVYTVVSPRARGLSIGVNMNPDRRCNFDCVYCEVARGEPPRDTRLDVDVMAAELAGTLARVHQGDIRHQPAYRTLPPELLRLRHIALSGDGEPTLAPEFTEALQAVLHLRAQRRFPFFKLVLITNATGLDRPEVQQGLRYFTPHDEVWTKLDAGSPAYLDKINRSTVLIDDILANILQTARRRPVVIQSLFAAINGECPSNQEIERYVQRLADLRNQGAQISLVQIYSATRPTPHSTCGHLPLRTLSSIAQAVRQIGLRAEVF